MSGRAYFEVAASQQRGGDERAIRSLCRASWQAQVPPVSVCTLAANPASASRARADFSVSSSPVRVPTSLRVPSSCELFSSPANPPRPLAPPPHPDPLRAEKTDSPLAPLPLPPSPARRPRRSVRTRHAICAHTRAHMRTRAGSLGRTGITRRGGGGGVSMGRGNPGSRMLRAPRTGVQCAAGSSAGPGPLEGDTRRDTAAPRCGWRGPRRTGLARAHRDHADPSPPLFLLPRSLACLADSDRPV